MGKGDDMPMYIRACNLCSYEAAGPSRARAIELLKQHKKKEHYER